MGKNKPSPYRKRRPTPNGLIHKKAEKIYDFHEADDRLYDIFRNHGFGDVPHEKRHQLVRFYQTLMKQQNKENFTRLVRFRDIAIKHFIDCLMIPKLIPLQFPLLDIGTGPGFPGVPLKIMHPKERVILAEGVRKRVNFLKSVREELHLENLDILGRYINEDFSLPCPMMITRAVSQIVPTLQMIDNALPPGGQMVFMKGPNVTDEIKEAESKVQGYFLKEFIEYTLPKTTHKRTLVLFEKVEKK